MIEVNIIIISIIKYLSIRFYFFYFFFLRQIIPKSIKPIELIARFADICTKYEP